MRKRVALVTAEAACRAIALRASAVDILVNADEDAGATSGTPMLIDDITPEDWQAMMAQHLSLPFFLAMALIPRVVARGWGRVINIDSLAAKAKPEEAAHYAASKAGVIGFSRVAAAEFGCRGVTVNCVAPGRFHPPQEEAVDVIARTPANRLGVPRDVAGLTSFLASSDAAFINGATIDLNGGYFTS